jgi:tripartite-type tricarboxylate transporter receptor subunit TctC
VPYRSSASGLQDMVAGSLDLYCPLAASVLPLIEAKSIKVPAVLSRQRSPLLPDTATAAEQGFPEIDHYYWIALFAPNGTPGLAIARIADAADKSLDDPATQSRLREVGTTIMPPERRNAAYLRKFLAEEIAKWAVIIKASGVSLD